MRRIALAALLAPSAVLYSLWLFDAPDKARAFDDLVAALRATEEWSCVEREVDIRLAR